MTAMDADLQARIERLYENEALTDNLTDADAKTLLHWAEEQLRAHSDESLVTAALSAANASDAADSAALLAQAQTFLAQQLHAQQPSAAHPATATDAAPAAPPPATSSSPPMLEASGAVGVEIVSDAHVNAQAGVAAKPKKPRRAAKAKSKK